MDAKKCLVTCLNCGGKSRINIVAGSTVLYVDQTPIISCRLRGDLNWGFECLCGNDSRLAPQEANQAHVLVQSTSPSVVQRLIDGLKIKDKLKFTMAEVR